MEMAGVVGPLGVGLGVAKVTRALGLGLGLGLAKVTRALGLGLGLGHSIGHGDHRNVVPTMKLQASTLLLQRSVR